MEVNLSVGENSNCVLLESDLPDRMEGLSDELSVDVEPGTMNDEISSSYIACEHAREKKLYGRDKCSMEHLMYV